MIPFICKQSSKLKTNKTKLQFQFSCIQASVDSFHALHALQIRASFSDVRCWSCRKAKVEASLFCDTNMMWWNRTQCSEYFVCRLLLSPWSGFSQTGWGGGHIVHTTKLWNCLYLKCNSQIWLALNVAFTSDEPNMLKPTEYLCYSSDVLHLFLVWLTGLDCVEWDVKLDCNTEQTLLLYHYQS